VLEGLDRDVEVRLPWAVRKAEVVTVLNGYSPSNVPPHIPLVNQSIDLGQRVRSMPPHLGQYAAEKSLQATNFAKCASEA